MSADIARCPEKEVKNLSLLRTTSLKGIEDASKSERPGFPEEPFVTRAILVLQGSYMCQLPELAAQSGPHWKAPGSQATFQWTLPCSVFWIPERVKGGGSLRPGQRRAWWGPNLAFSPRQRQRDLFQAQKRTSISGACVFASTYYQLSLQQSFPNGMSKSPGRQLAAWFGRIPFSFPMFYGFFFWRFSKSLFYKLVFYIALPVLREKINIFNVFSEAYAPIEKMYPLWT